MRVTGRIDVRGASVDAGEVDMTRLWLIRLGRNGEYEAAALSDNVVTVDFGISDKEDLSLLKDRKSLVRKMAELFPQDKPGRQHNFATQVNQFLNIAQLGDLVITPFTTTSTIAVGEIAGPGTAHPKGETRRAVRWLRMNIPRDAFRKDLLFNFGFPRTVYEVCGRVDTAVGDQRRKEALRRLKAVLATGRDPGGGTSATLS